MNEAVQIVLTFLAMAVLCGLLERVWPEDASTSGWRVDTYTDVLYFALRILLSAGLALVTALAGTTLPHHGSSAVGELPFAGQLILFLFLSDFIQYWMHRGMHWLTPLWHVHAVHHSPDRVDWLVASRVHPFELLFNKAVSAVPLYLVGFSPTVIAVSVPLVACYSLLLHANLKWSYGTLGYVVASPAFHRWHHSLDQSARDKNFAQTFAFIDFLFGTAYFPRDRRPALYGLSGSDMPPGIWGQFLYPIQAWCKVGRSRMRQVSGPAPSGETAGSSTHFVHLASKSMTEVPAKGYQDD